MSFTEIDNNTEPIIRLNDTEIYLDKSSNNVEKKESFMDKKWEIDDVNQLAECLNEGMTIKELMELFKSVNGSTENNLGQEYVAEDDDYIEILPPIKRSTMMVGAPSNAGKSVFVGNWIRNWQENHLDEENQVYIFCKAAEDPAFNDIDHVEVVVNLDKLEELQLLQLADFSNCLLVFDDLDMLTDKVLSNWVTNFAAEAYTAGRKMEISVVYVTHLFQCHAKTRVPLSESEILVMFPGLGDRGIEKVLTEYAQMKKPKVDKVLSLTNSRWAALYRSVKPRYLVHEKGFYITN